MNMIGSKTSITPAASSRTTFLIKELEILFSNLQSLDLYFKIKFKSFKVLELAIYNS